MNYSELKKGLVIGMAKTDNEVRAAWLHMQAQMYELMAERALALEGKAERNFNEIQLDIANLQQDMTGFKIIHPEKQIWPMKYND